MAVERHSDHPLILLANRDEFYERASANAAVWEDHPNVFAGRDLVGGGTWLGVTSNGRFAAVTNYRDPAAPTGVVSRGKLVSEFLTNDVRAADYAAEISAKGADYSGFNLIVGEVTSGDSDIVYLSNRGRSPVKIGPGIYGLSNHLLDTPWPKVQKGKYELERLIATGAGREAMFTLLSDRTPAEDGELPSTGIGYEREKALSSIFISTDDYGTRCSTVLTADRDGKFDLEERVFV